MSVPSQARSSPLPGLHLDALLPSQWLHLEETHTNLASVKHDDGQKPNVKQANNIFLDSLIFSLYYKARFK